MGECEAWVIMALVALGWWAYKLLLCIVVKGVVKVSCMDFEGLARSGNLIGNGLSIFILILFIFYYLPNCAYKYILYIFSLIFLNFR